MLSASVLLERTRTQIASARIAASSALLAELAKGCHSELTVEPVALEPAYTPFATIRDLLCDVAGPDWVRTTPPALDELVRLTVHGCVDAAFDWNRCELFLKQLAGLQHRTGLEVSGNAAGQTVTLLAHRHDCPQLAAAFRAWFPGAELAVRRPEALTDADCDWSEIRLRDYYPPPPYTHLLTQPRELRDSPFAALLVALRQIEPPALGCYQCLFQAVAPDHAWHLLVELLRDLEFDAKLVRMLPSVYRHPQQAPSGDLRRMAEEVDRKAHNDKPFFATAVRLAAIGAGAASDELLSGLGGFVQLFQHGGRPLVYVPPEHYRDRPRIDVRDLLLRGVTYRPGFLLNSAELCGLAHPPPATLKEQHQLQLEVLDALTLPEGELRAGTPVGVYRRAGVTRIVALPMAVRYHGVHVIGGTGTGKSCLLCHMILADILAGHGVVVIDPHGDLVRQILGLLPETAIARTVHFRPGDPEWIPLWNPLRPVPGQHPARLAGELVTAFRCVNEGWGDRVAFLLRHAFYGLLHVPNSTLQDVALLLRERSRSSDAVRAELERLVDNPVAKLFWREDFAKYRRDAIGPPQHKLSKLLLAEAGAMFAQPESAIDLQRVLRDGQVFLADLSALESEAADMIGGFVLNLFDASVLARSALSPEQRRSFLLYCDECHRFVPDTLEALLCQARKFNVGVTLAHQHQRQLSRSAADALASVGATVIFNVGRHDAAVLADSLRGKVDVDTLSNLAPFEALLRASGQIARLTTPKWRPDWSRDRHDAAVVASRRLYYRHVTPQPVAATPVTAADRVYTYDVFD